MNNNCTSVLISQLKILTLKTKKSTSDITEKPVSFSAKTVISGLISHLISMFFEVDPFLATLI
jgi:hypothetical protein